MPKRITFVLKPAIADKLHAICKNNDRSMQKTIEQLIEREHAYHESGFTDKKVAEIRYDCKRSIMLEIVSDIDKKYDALEKKIERKKIKKEE